MFFENTLQKETISITENLKISKVDPGKLDDSFSPRDGPVARQVRHIITIHGKESFRESFEGEDLAPAADGNRG